MKMDRTVSNRIAMLRPILIFGVVFVHVSGLSDNPADLVGVFQHFAGFFKDAVFRGTVPTMALVAGYLLFSANLDLAPVKLFKKKFTTLAVPFFVFNLGYILFMVMLKYAFNVVIGTDYTAVHQVWWSEAVLGMYTYPANAPLHFVRDMLVTVALAPVLGLAIRSTPWLGLAVITIIFGTNQDGHLILRGSSFILFYIGGMAAVGKWNVLALDKYAKYLLAAFLLMCLGHIVFEGQDNTYLVMSAPFMVWSSMSLLQNTRVEAWAMKWTKYSFFVFAAHMPLLVLSWWFVLNHARWVPFPVYWFAAPLVTIGALAWVYDFAMQYAPTAFNFAIGSRAPKPAFVDRRKAPRPVNAPVFSPEYRAALISQ